MTENMILLAAAIAAFVLLLLPQRLGLGEGPKKVLYTLVWILIAMIVILQFFVFA